MLELVVIILGIIVAGGFLLYFIGDILMRMSKNCDRDDSQDNKKQEATTKIVEKTQATESDNAALVAPFVSDQKPQSIIAQIIILETCSKSSALHTPK